MLEADVHEEQLIAWFDSCIDFKVFTKYWL